MFRLFVIALSTITWFSPAVAGPGDVARGQRDFRICAPCHSLEPNQNMTGPSLAGLWDRKAGSLPSFERYSDALKSSGIIWEDRSLDGWLTDPDRPMLRGLALMPGGLHIPCLSKRGYASMAFYSDIILPRLCDLAMRNKQLRPYRERVIGAAEGRVLEIGIGSGRNLPFYRPQVTELLALEPAPKLLAMARDALRPGLQVSFIEASAEAIPLDDRTVDTVVTTWTLCSIPQAATALTEMRRVLRPNGKLLFVEHGMAPDKNVRRWQDWLTPAWKRISGGCHLNRPIGTMIESAGFRIDRVETGYMPGPKAMTFMYEGSARPG